MCLNVDLFSLPLENHSYFIFHGLHACFSRWSLKLKCPRFPSSSTYLSLFGIFADSVTLEEKK